MNLQGRHLAFGLFFSVLAHLSVAGFLMSASRPVTAAQNRKTTILTVSFSQAANTQNMGQQVETSSQPQIEKRPAPPEPIEIKTTETIDPMPVVKTPVKKFVLEYKPVVEPTPFPKISVESISKPLIIPVAEIEPQAVNKPAEPTPPKQVVIEEVPLEQPQPLAAVTEPITCQPLAQSILADAGSSVASVSDTQNFADDPLSNEGQSIADYRKQMIQMIKQNKTYPRKARQKGLEGRVIVSFTVLENGQVRNIHLGASRASVLLKRAVLKLIKKSQPLPSPPQNNMKLTLSIDYRLTD